MKVQILLKRVFLGCFFLALHNPHVASSPEDNICGLNDEGKTVCCAYYYKLSDECIKCPLGSTGLRCDRRCKFPEYGELCLQKCNCSRERCHYAYGCLAMTSEAVNEQFTSTSTGISRHENNGISLELGETLKMYGFISIVIGAVVVILLLIVIIQRQSQECGRQKYGQNKVLEEAPATYESVPVIVNHTDHYTQLQNHSETLGRGVAQLQCGRTQIPYTDQSGTSFQDRQCSVL
ncbi:uncharacterized protein LOC125654974 isoform X2 [Ostrea edulis]|uniref:uncharacterized protein LOC125654974 isoform X2 n=1 Tax=Ostrea edulis TaxID=37623 RepID=UPI0024AEB14A|nr:uncharacterized protein LOC125654974 isoform X2 [Ostrea edulis]